MSTLTIRLPDDTAQRLKSLAQSRGLSMNKLVEQLSAHALSAWDTENHFRAMAATGDVQTALAVALPLLLLGFGHGLLNPPALAGTVGVLPALAGSAAAVAGLMQQLTGATGGYLVGLVPHDGAVNLGWMMLAFALTGAVAQFFLRRR